VSVCAAAIVLALDVSGSVSAAHADMQRDETAAALTSPAVIHAAQDGLAVAAIMFGSYATTVMHWRVIHTAEDAQAAAEHLRRQPRAERGGTNVAGALRASLGLLDAIPCTPERRIIDISGDGRNSGGNEAVAEVVADVVASGTELNALPIIADEPDVADWYREHVTGPANGFTIEATPESFARAIRLKLSLEVASK
jgi:hypothetical protein